MAANLNELIFIKRVKKHPHHAAHGGAWKIAYADFVTAMMAFFLLLWLLSSTSQDQKTAISNYFAPQSVSESTSGAGGMLGGRVLDTQGAMTASRANPRITLGAPQIQPGTDIEVESPKDGEEAFSGPLEKHDLENMQDEALGAVPVHDVTARDQTAMGTTPENDAQDAQNVALARAKENSGQELVEGTGGSFGVNQRDTAGIMAKGGAAGQEDKELAEIERKLKESVEKDAELRQFRSNIKVERTIEGIRIQLIDDDKREMFPAGSAELLKHTGKLFKAVADLVKDQPNRIAISGHTDSTPYRGAGGYSNWELSTDRANASRRALMAAGVPENRIARVVGRADSEPIDAANSKAATNRRVSIVLLSEGDSGGPSGAKADASKPQAAASPSQNVGSSAATPAPLPSLSQPTPSAVVAKPGVPPPTLDKPAAKPMTIAPAQPTAPPPAEETNGDGEPGLRDNWLRLR